MEENSAAVECLILFYINVKHVLKTKQLIEKVFITQMVKHCKESGFNYTDEEIKNTWKNLVSKYVNLKTYGTVEEKENWKYYEILDSSYEQSDFHNGVNPKFSDDIIWFLIQCFLKRKALKNSQKHSNIVNDIHNEFLQNGYLHITKQDIEKKWRNLHVKYNRYKNNLQNLSKFPYLQAVGKYEDKEEIANMVFTKDLTEILIERFTEKKVTCVIHGYDSDQVLSEIQSEFKDLGFYFSKEDIKEKWKSLTNVYKFIRAKGKGEKSWIYLDAMDNHFKDDFLFPYGKMKNRKTNERNDRRTKRVRHRSKSADDHFTNREGNKISPKCEMNVKEKRKHDRKGKSNKKLKLSDRTTENLQENIESDRKDIYEEENLVRESKILNTTQIIKSNVFKSGVQVRNLSMDQEQEIRDNNDLGSPTSKVHIINIDHSDIDHKNGNLTINLPSITKQFSDNEFLPLKKRLRLEGGNNVKHVDEPKDTNKKFVEITSMENEDSETEKGENKRITEEEMKEIMEQINREKLNNEKCSNYFDLDFNNYQNMYNCDQPCLLVPKEECRDSLPIQNYSNSNTISQPPPVLLLVIKVDGTNPVKGASNNVNIKVNGDISQSTKNLDKRTDDQPTKQEPSSTILHTAEGLTKTNQSSNITMQSTNHSISPEVSTSYDKTGEKLDIVNSTIVDINTCSSNIVFNENVTVPMESLKIDREDEYTKNKNISNTDSFSETMCPVESSQSELQKVDIEIQERLPVVEKPVESKSLSPNKTSSIISENKGHTEKSPTHVGKVRLPVKGGGNIKEIFISPHELTKISNSKQIKNTFLKPPNLRANKANISINKPSTEFNFISEVVKQATNENSSVGETEKPTNFYRANLSCCVNTSSTAPHSSKIKSKFITLNSFYQNRNDKNEEFENDSVFSEAAGDEDGLKDNLLATVIDFQEQNNQEFMEIKNLMKQNNLLQRETNRLLRLLLEKQ